MCYKYPLYVFHIMLAYSQQSIQIYFWQKKKKQNAE